MDNNIKELHDLCETVMHEIADANKKIAQNSGKISAGDVSILDGLTHMLKSLKTTIAMEEGRQGYSGRYSGRMENGYSGRMPYEGGNSYGGDPYDRRYLDYPMDRRY